MDKHWVKDWSDAIAFRITDMIPYADLDKEDRELLLGVLEKALRAVPDEMEKLIGTAIIEEDYFEDC